MEKNILLSKDGEQVIEICDGVWNPCIGCGNCMFKKYNGIDSCYNHRPKPCVRRIFGKEYSFHFEEA